MKAVIQRVGRASVEVEGKIVGKIGRGLLIYLGVIQGDTEKQAHLLARKIVHYRLFHDENKRMNLSLIDIRGEALVVSQFTLAADGRKGNRPSFDKAAAPDEATALYEIFVNNLQSSGVHTQTGVFGAYMQVASINDGPVTFILEK